MTWENIGQIDGYHTRGESGTSIDLAADGKTIIIGSPNYASASTYSGALSPGYVQVLDYDRYGQGRWRYLGSSYYYPFVGSKNQEHFGEAVSISNDGRTIAIGAPYESVNSADDNSYENHGTVRVYTYSSEDDDWAQVGSTIEGGYRADYLGRSVSLSGDGSILAVGSPGALYTNYGEGKVNIFSLQNSEWVETAEFFPFISVGDRPAFGHA